MLPPSRRGGGAGPGRSLPRHIALPPALLTCLLPPRRRRPPTWPQPRRRTPGCSSPCCCSCPRRPPSSAPRPGPTWAAASPTASAAPTPSAAVSGGRRGRASPRERVREGGRVWGRRGTAARRGAGSRCPVLGARRGREAAPRRPAVNGRRCERRVPGGDISRSSPGAGAETGASRENGNAAPAAPLLPRKFSDPHSSLGLGLVFFVCVPCKAPS